MATGGKPSVKYHWFPAELGTSVLVEGKRKDDFPVPFGSHVLFDQPPSFVDHSSSVLTVRQCKPAFKTLRSLVSQSVEDFLSGTSGTNLDSKEGSCIGNCSGLLVNINGIGSQEDTLFLYSSGQTDAAKLPLANSKNCNSDLKAASCLPENISLDFQVHKSIKQSPSFDPRPGGNIGTLFSSCISSIKFGLPIRFAEGHGCGRNVEFPGWHATGLFCDLRRPISHLEKLCWFKKLLNGQSFPTVCGTWNSQGASSAQNGSAVGFQLISDNFRGREVNGVSNILRKDDFRGYPTFNESFKPLNAGVEENHNEFLPSMDQMGESSSNKGAVAVLRSSDLLFLSRLHQSLKFSPFRIFSSGMSQGILESYCLSRDSIAGISSGLLKEFGDLRGEGNLDERTMNQVAGLVNSEESLRADSCAQKTVRRSPSPKMGDNALAGALAGVFVSLWLHPIDTVKTIIQARSAGHRSVFHNLGSIMSERGIGGLYRGIGSNLASSAPISAIYTFTYESVKAALLPHLSKECHAFAHCVAGGCASIATSVIFTPSECIKQQMQVGSQYSSSWRALTGILDKGGLPLLYAGWGAVLCRNVPQSVIKFYTYEGLKHWAQNSHTTETRLSTLQTLAFGGLAGSTAALFTTPFDVIKTRLQTQIPGSTTYYEGVFHALQCIARQEGLGGLYRGLLPRLVIYVSQGALFFASYEFFKRVLSIEVRRLSIQTSQSGAKDMSQSKIVKPSM